MHIAYTALKQTHDSENNAIPEAEHIIRYEAYQAACYKHSNLIAEIQKYFPGWMPDFKR